MGNPVQIKAYLLGPPQIKFREQILRISRRQVRGLIFRLAASNTPIAREELHALFWAEKPDNTARRNLSRSVSYLRQALPDPTLVQVTPETIALDPNRVWSDVGYFLNLSPQASNEDLEKAISFVSGPFLDGFYLPNNRDYEDWQITMQQKVSKQNQILLDELITRNTAAKDYKSAIEYSRLALAADNLDESRHRQLMILYAANGDRRAAHRQYEECVATLERELGVAPLPETRSIFDETIQKRAIKPPSLPTPRWTTLPSLDLPLTGRKSAWEQLERARQRLQSGGVIWISGEAGIGKSRLMQDFVNHAQTMVLTGNAFPSTQSIPYAPLLAALRPIMDQPDLLKQIPENWLAEMRTLLPELKTAIPHLPQPLPLEPEQAQGRHFEALAQTFLNLSKQVPLWLCIDDLHWADETTLNWLNYFNERLIGSEIIVVITSRTTEMDYLETYLKQARRSNQFIKVQLETLDLQSIEKLLLSLPDPIRSPVLAERLLHASGGNTFFILEILRALLERGQIKQPPKSLPIPHSIREVISTRLNLVSPLAIQILEAAVILETNLQPKILEIVSGRQENETIQGMAELVNHQILRTDRKSLQFQHDLTRITVLDGLHFWRQQTLHHRAASALSNDPFTHPTVVAHHWEQAEDWEKSAAAYGKATQLFAHQYAYQDALIQVEKGLALLEKLLDPKPLRLQLLVLRMQLHQVLLQMDEWKTDLQTVEGLATVLGDETAQLHLLESKLSLLTLQSDISSLETTAEKALTLAQKISDQRAKAGIHHILGWHLSDVAGRPFDGIHHLERAVELAKKLDDSSLLYTALCNLAFCQRALGFCRDALKSAKQALLLTPTSEDPHPAQADALREIAEAAGYLARWQEARTAMHQVVHLYEGIGDPWALGAALYNLGLFTSAMGQHSQAVAAMRRLVALGVEVGLPPDSEFGIIHRAGLAKVLIDSGDIAGAEEIFQSLNLPEFITGRARIDYANIASGIALMKGNADAALKILDPVIQEQQISRVSHFIWTLLLHAWAAHQTGENQQALQSLTQVEEFFGQGDCVRLARWFYFLRYQITGDRDALKAAYTELQRQADLFTDLNLRADFLNKVVINQNIAKASKLPS